jgi:archaellum component FlaC
MINLSLRTALLTIITLSVSANANANGLMEDARQLYFADITDAYNDTVKYLEANNTTDGAAAVKELHEQVKKLADMSSRISSDANALESPLPDMWNPSSREIDQLKSAVQTLENQVGREPFRLDDLKSRYASTGSALERSYESMKTFGQKFKEMSDRAKNAQNYFSGELTSAYQETLKYLKANNTVDGATAVKKLKQLTLYLSEATARGREAGKALSSSLGEVWERAEADSGRLNTIVGVLEVNVGREPFSVDSLEDIYEEMGETLEKTSANLAGFQEKFKTVCDSCQ